MKCRHASEGSEGIVAIPVKNVAVIKDLSGTLSNESVKY